MVKLSVIGLGKLGACSAVCFASKGFEVIGVDINKNLVNAINRGIAPFYEPELQELITAAKGKLRATQDYKEAVLNSDITFLIVPTPSREDGHFSDRYLLDALKCLSEALKEIDKKYHLFVITSTVSPGTTEKYLIPLVESVSKKKLNKDFGVCYNPEFIALGSVIKDFLNPDMVLIGESDGFAGVQLVKIYEKVCKNKPCIARMSIISAEITKISLNSYITMKISFANTIANICERVPGANIDAITKALGSDKRISPYYLKGAISYGGPCFPRDNRAFIAFARQYGCEAKLAKATDEVNDSKVEHLIELVLSHLPSADNNVVAILGLAYKPNTAVIEESPAIKIINELVKRSIKIIVYDPLAVDNTRLLFGDAIDYASSLRECISSASLCIITLPLDEFKTIDDSFITHNPTTVIDCWRIIDPQRLNKRIKYVAVGKG